MGTSKNSNNTNAQTSTTSNSKEIRAHAFNTETKGVYFHPVAKGALTLVGMMLALAAIANLANM